MAEKEKVARKSSTLDHRGDRNAEGSDAHSRSPIKNKKDKVTYWDRKPSKCLRITLSL